MYDIEDKKQSPDPILVAKAQIVVAIVIAIIGVVKAISTLMGPHGIEILLHGGGLMLPIVLELVALFIGGLSVSGIKDIKKRQQTIKILNERGKLIKGMPCTFQLANTIDDDPRIRFFPIVKYAMPNGETKELWGEAQYAKSIEEMESLKKVDVLLDESDPTIHLVRPQINRVSGNLPSDYYSDGVTENGENNPVF